LKINGHDTRISRYDTYTVNTTKFGAVSCDNAFMIHDAESTLNLVDFSQRFTLRN